MQIRKATKKDVRRISYLIKRNTENVLENHYSEEQKRTWKKANTPKAIAESFKRRTLFCAIQNNRLAGTIALQENEVVGLYVSYSKRGQGIGWKLLQHLEQYARSKGIDTLVLTSTPSALAFYQRNGYIAQGPVVVNVGGVDFYETRMSKRLGGIV